MSKYLDDVYEGYLNTCREKEVEPEEELKFFKSLVESCMLAMGRFSIHFNHAVVTTYDLPNGHMCLILSTDKSGGLNLFFAVEDEAKRSLKEAMKGQMRAEDSITLAKEEESGR